MYPMQVTAGWRTPQSRRIVFPLHLVMLILPNGTTRDCYQKSKENHVEDRGRGQRGSGQVREKGSDT